MTGAVADQTTPSARTADQTTPSARTAGQTTPSARTADQTTPSARTADQTTPSARPAVGIVGGGQLARMVALAAGPLGVPIRVLAGPSDEGAAGMATVRRGDIADTATLLDFAASVDVVTFDHELVPLDAIRSLEEAGVTVRPGSRALALSDKAELRNQLGSSFPFAPHRLCCDLDDVGRFAEEHGWPVVIKAARGGYDGRGVFVVGDLGQAAGVLADLAATLPAVIEPLLALDAEIAVVVVRGAAGDRVIYPPVRTRQVDGICHEVVYPTGLDPEVERQAVELAEALAERADVIGVLAVELFVVDGTVLVNELAPRPHNSAHWTIDGAETSQFENHVRAVLGWPLGPAAATFDAVATVNVIAEGDWSDPRGRVAEALSVRDARLHLYDKSPRPGRKVGHVTARGDSVVEVLARARAAAAALGSTTTSTTIRRR